LTELLKKNIKVDVLGGHSIELKQGDMNKLDKLVAVT